MDRILELQKVESMRKMMLMQEQLFKQQVEELHRIYNLQKKLMQKTKRLTQQTELIEAADTTKSESAIRHQAAIETIQSFNGRNDPKELSCSNLVKFDLEMPAQTESRSTPSSSIHPFEEKNDLKRMEGCGSGTNTEHRTLHEETKIEKSLPQLQHRVARL